MFFWLVCLNIVNLSRFVSFNYTSLMRMHMTFLYVSHQMKLRFWLLWPVRTAVLREQ